jgi:hypothetical protein
MISGVGEQCCFSKDMEKENNRRGGERERER